MYFHLLILITRLPLSYLARSCLLVCPLFSTGKLAILKSSLNSASLSEYFHKCLSSYLLNLFIFSVSKYVPFVAELQNKLLLLLTCKFDGFWEPFHWIWCSRLAKVNT